MYTPLPFNQRTKKNSSNNDFCFPWHRNQWLLLLPVHTQLNCLVPGLPRLGLWVCCACTDTTLFSQDEEVPHKLGDVACPVILSDTLNCTVHNNIQTLQDALMGAYEMRLPQRVVLNLLFQLEMIFCISCLHARKKKIQVNWNVKCYSFAKLSSSGIRTKVRADKSSNCRKKSNFCPVELLSSNFFKFI